jgi:hypothetical protein
VVIALAGRRVDAANAETISFPLTNVSLVSRRLEELFTREAATALVSSAACGGDLTALAVAGARGMRRRIVLPFDRRQFRGSSVTDRPGDWGALYDRVLAELDPSDDIVTLDGRNEGDRAYAAANQAVLQEAIALARQSNIVAMAVLVWDGAPRGSDDLTAAFAEEARTRGLRVAEVRTL